jgi:hypothetical protein
VVHLWPGELDALIAEMAGFNQVRDSVQAETVHAPIEPEAHGIEHGRLDFRIAPVQVGLAVEEEVIVVLAGGRVQGPGRTSEDRAPVVRRLAGGAPISPDVPVAAGMRPAGARFLKPAMLVRCVVEHQIQDDPDAAAVRFVEQALEVLQGAVLRRDGGVVRDVVAAVELWGRVVRREPDGVDSQVGQVVQPGGDSGQVTDAIVVAVGEAARIDLVENGAFPPRRWVLHHAAPVAGCLSAGINRAIIACPRVVYRLRCDSGSDFP